jgi:hypothetical protein
MEGIHAKCSFFKKWKTWGTILLNITKKFIFAKHYFISLGLIGTTGVESYLMANNSLNQSSLSKR